MEGNAAEKGSRSINLHPLVIINVSDHFTRVKVGGAAPASSLAAGAMVLGMLFGVQDGLTVHIYDSFELKFDVAADGTVALDNDYIKTKKEQFEAIFPTFELLGWYATGKEVTARDMQVHKLISDFNESPLFMLVEPNVSPDAKNLPIYLHEAVVHMVSEVPTMVFVNVEYKIDTVESERISLDHVARQAPAKDDKTSVVDAHLKGMQSSTQTLVQRVQVLTRYLQLVHAGKLPKNHVLLREVNAVCKQLPVVDPTAFKQAFADEYSDALLVGHLASLTRGLGIANQLLDKFQITQEKRKHFMY